MDTFNERARLWLKRRRRRKNRGACLQIPGNGVVTRHEAPSGANKQMATDTPPANPAGPSSPAALPSSIWALGFVSLFMDISSEMIHALLPIYLVTTLGASTLTIGFIEGIAEATANITKIFSGVLSDWLGHRKLLTTVGYGLAALTKPIFPLAATVGWVVAARFIDRIGKGIRDAPRDALVADLAPPDLRGASFGLRQALDTVGAFAGPLAAIALMALTSDDFRFVFWIAIVPAFIALAVMIFAVKEPIGHATDAKPRLHLADMKRLSGLCARGLSSWRAFGSDRSERTARARHGMSRGCGSHPCARHNRGVRDARGRILGTAYGAHARTVCEPRR